MIDFVVTDIANHRRLWLHLQNGGKIDIGIDTPRIGRMIEDIENLTSALSTKREALRDQNLELTELKATYEGLKTEYEVLSTKYNELSIKLLALTVTL